MWYCVCRAPGNKQEQRRVLSSEILEELMPITPWTESSPSPKAPRGLFFVPATKRAQGFLLILLFIQASFTVDAAFWHRLGLSFMDST